MKWKKYQHRPASESSLRRWFRSGEDGVGVIFGEVSDGLVSRDFDTMAAYDQWVADYPDLAAYLPTVVTSRGRHVYGRASSENVSELRRRLGKSGGTGAIHVRDGELRVGVGCYSVLPPSRHPSGHIYRWDIPLPEGPLPIVDLLNCGFVDFHQCDREHRENGGYGGELRIQRTTDAISGCGNSLLKNQPPGDCPEAHNWSTAILSAIAESLPTGPGQRHRQVFELARALKAIPELADADPRLLRTYVQRWHELALPEIRTKPFEETWIDFLRAWPNVKFPKGQEPMSMILEKACSSSLPEVAERYEQPAFRSLVSLCRELQRAAGDGPFYLSCRTAGRLLDVDHSTANRWLFLLVSDGVLEEVEKGDRKKRRASRYRYLAPL